MYAEISAAIQSVKTVAELANAANTISNHNELMAAVADVNSKLMEATAVALAAQERHSGLLNKIADLEKLVSNLAAKQTRADRYQLHKFPTGSLVYKLKEEAEGDEPMHFLCAKCVDTGGHTKLQPWGARRLKCFACDKIVQIEADPPSAPRQIAGRSSYLSG
jgi:hypothetical protein